MRKINLIRMGFYSRIEPSQKLVQHRKIKMAVTGVSEYRLQEYLEQNPTATHKQILDAFAGLAQTYYCVWSVDDIDWNAVGIDPDTVPDEVKERIMLLAEHRADYSIGFGHESLRHAVEEILSPQAAFPLRQ
jgi:hypothetical protein